MTESDNVAFSRTSATGEPLGELRINSKRITLGVIDAVAASEAKVLGKSVSRTDIVNRLLDEFAHKKIQEAILIKQVTELNPTVLEALQGGGSQ